jgi:ion channel POLLUX/CASTOR
MDMGKQKNLRVLKKSLRYWFENTLSKGTVAVIYWLTALTILTALFFGFIMVLFHLTPNENVQHFSFLEAFWQSILHSIDTGAIQNDSSWAYRIIAIIVTLIGVFIFSALVGVLTNGLEQAFEKLAQACAKLPKDLLSFNQYFLYYCSRKSWKGSHKKDAI